MTLDDFLNKKQALMPCGYYGIELKNLITETWSTCLKELISKKPIGQAHEILHLIDENQIVEEIDDYINKSIDLNRFYFKSDLDEIIVQAWITALQNLKSKVWLEMMRLESRWDQENAKVAELNRKLNNE